MRSLNFSYYAPRALGAFLLLLVLPGCEKKTDSTEWSGPTVQEEAANPPAEVDNPPPVPAEEPEAAPAQSVRFIAFNVENWLTMDRYIDGKRQKSKAKPDKEKDAVVSVLVHNRPDIVGLCEIGTKADLADLQHRLREAGLDLPHSHHTGGADPTRRLAMLSRLPIISTELHEDLPFELEGKARKMSRGILDATVKTPVGPVRFLGAHLKSKREVPEADQEMIRRAEAHLMRDQATKVLTDDPSTQLIVYGDFNDTRQSSSIRTLRGKKGTPTNLGLSFLRDSRGETWTHNWEYQDVYSRFDYVLFSRNFDDIIDWDHCRIIDDPMVLEGSDHRPLIFVLK